MRRLLAMVLVCCVSNSAWSSMESINVKAGGVQTIKLTNVIETLAVGNPAVVDVRITELNELLIIGKALGYSELVLWYSDGGSERYEIKVNQAEERAPPDIPLVDSQEVLELEVHVAEIKSRTLRESGIQWSGSLQGPEAGILDGRPFLNLDTSLSTSLRLIQERGEGRILATPVLRVENGRSAEFVVGGEVPLPQTSLQGIGNVEFRRYGVVLEVHPEITADGKIRTTVFSELSNLDAAVSVQGIPGLLTRQTTSTVTVKPGNTLILSGLISAQEFASSSQPGFASTVNDQTELVVFITPELLTNKESQEQARQQLLKHLQNHISQAGCQGMLELGHGGI